MSKDNIYHLKPIFVLLLEDDDGDAYMLMEDLDNDTQNAYDVTRVLTLSDALEAIRSNQFDIILSDLNVPDSQGTETYHQFIKETDLPIIVLTGDENSDLPVKAIEEGVQDFIVKNNLDKYDVSNAIKYAIERQKINHTIEKSNYLKSEFLANMSHEIRTPLNGIIGATELLAKTNISEDQQKYLNIITNSGDTLLGLINDILDISKIEAGELDINTEPLLLRDFIHAQTQLLVPKASAKNIEILTEYKGNIPFSIMADSVRLGQILNNLLSNAIKFTEEGHITIKIEERGITDNVCHLCFEIEDTGIGIPEDKQESIFNKFAQADASTTKEYGGTGLGLAITEKLIKMMGGNIGLESKPGQGTTFFIDIPLQIVELNSKDESIKTTNEIVNLKVLVVDDSPILLQFVSSCLEQFEIQHESTTNPLDTINLLKKAKDSGHPFDVLLVDYEMPNLNGGGLAKQIRDDPDIGSIRIILISSLGKMEIKEHEMESRLFNGYLLKPINSHDIRQKLYEICILGAGVQQMNTHKTFLNNMNKLNSHILLVENEMVNQMVATDMLESIGCTVDLAENGQIAIDKMFGNKGAVHKYDAVLMDCMMPVMDGFDATQKIRNIEKQNKFAASTIIALTANAMAEEKNKCLIVGMDDYLAKPVKEKELYEKLKAYVGKEKVA